MAFITSVPLTSNSKSHCSVNLYNRIGVRPLVRKYINTHSLSKRATQPTTTTATATAPKTSSSIQPQQPHSSTYNWSSNWYPIYLIRNITPGKIHTFTLLNTNYILYISQATYKIFPDKCPHRLAPLSEGRLLPNDKSSQQNIQCSYHGWTFNADGKCINIPQLPLNGPIISGKKACLPPPLPISVKLGILFVWPDTEIEPTTSEPYIPDYLFGKDVEFSKPYFRRFPYGVDTLLENLVDPAHIPWAHHLIIENRSSGTKQRNSKVIIEYSDRDKINANVNDIENGKTSLKMLFKSPCLVAVKTVSPKPESTFSVMLTFWAVPIAKGESLLVSLTGFDSAPLPLKWYLRSQLGFLRCAEGHAVTDSDGYTLYKQASLLSKTNNDWKNGYCVTGWDSMVVAVRKWLDCHGTSEWTGVISNGKNNEYGGGNGELMSCDDVIDRWKWHSNDCVACRGAYDMAKMVKYFVIGVIVVLAICQGSGVVWMNGQRNMWLKVLFAFVLACVYFGAGSVQRLVTLWKRPYRISKSN